MKKRISIGVVVIIFIVSCIYSGLQYRKYKILENKTTLGIGMNYVDLQDKLVDFIYKVYMPQKETDIEDGINLLKEITTEDQYNLLLSEVGEYNKESEQKVVGTDVQYTTPANNTDHMAHIYLEVKLENKGIENVLIEFVINPNNKIFNHKISTSYVTSIN